MVRWEYFHFRIESAGDAGASEGRGVYTVWRSVRISFQVCMHNDEQLYSGVYVIQGAYVIRLVHTQPSNGELAEKILRKYT